MTEADVPEPLRISIFRILQEATANALKHARAERIKLSLTSAEGLLSLAIEDNGRGFDPKTAAGHRDFTRGIGLQSMRERAELSGGRYELQSSPGRGTRISVRWQLAQAAEPECPVIPMNLALARAICRSAANSEMAETLSACLECLRTEDSN